MNQPHAAYRDQIQRNQDGLLEPHEKAELQAHLDTCEACARYAQQLTQLEDRLSIDLPAAVPESVLPLEQRTRMAMDIVRQERKRQMNQRLSSITRNALLVGSAIVLLAVFVWAISHVRPTPAPAVNTTSTAAVTLPPENTPTGVLPSATPEITEQAAQERFTADAAGLSLDIPQGWKPSSANPLRYEGSDGFFDFQEINSAGSLMQACESTGNDERYGESPRFELTVIGDRTVCVIYTSLNRSDMNQDTLVFADDDAASPQRFFRLDVWDTARFEEIQASLKFTRPETAQIPNDVVSTPDSSRPPAEITPIVQQAAGLTIEEYPVVAQAVDTPTHFEFNDRIPAAVFEKRQAWRGYDPALQLEAANRLLEPFDYTLVASPQADTQAYNLMHAGQLVLENIVTIRPVSVYASGEDFLLQVETSDGQPRLVQKAGVQPWDPAQHYYFPAVLVGDKIAYLQPVGDANTVGVWVGDELVFRYHIIGLGPSNPIKALVGYGDHWALEIDGMVFIDGQSLNDQIGATEVFDWHILNSQPFYFFQKDQRYSISYAGETLPVTYDRVIHDLCCEPAGFNPGDNPTMTWFYALRDGMWTYVEIGSYPE